MCGMHYVSYRTPCVCFSVIFDIECNFLIRINKIIAKYLIVDLYL